MSILNDPDTRDRAPDSLATRLRQVRRVERARRQAPTPAARDLVGLALTVPALTVALLTVVLGVVMLWAGDGLRGLAATAAGGWLALHQVPLTLGGVTIGALPLLPTFLLMFFAARASAAAATKRGSRNEIIAGFAAAVAGPLVITALALAVLQDAAANLPVQGVDPLHAFGLTLGIHALAAGLGVGAAILPGLLDQAEVSAADRRGLRAGPAAVAALLAAAGAVVLVRLILTWGEAGALLGEANSFDGYLGLTALSVLYLPNVVIGAAAVLVGSSVEVGTLSAALIGGHTGAVPPLPILSVLPGASAPWAPALWVIPAAIGVALAWRLRRPDVLAAIRSLGVAAAVAAMIMVVGSSLVGGRLGELGSVAINVPAAAAYTVGWLLVPGLLTLGIYALLPSTRAARAAGLHLLDDLAEKDLADEDLDDLADEDLDDLADEDLDDLTDEDLADDADEDLDDLADEDLDAPSDDPGSDATDADDGDEDGGDESDRADVADSSDADSADVGEDEDHVETDRNETDQHAAADTAAAGKTVAAGGEQQTAQPMTAIDRITSGDLDETART